MLNHSCELYISVWTYSTYHYSAVLLPVVGRLPAPPAAPAPRGMGSSTVGVSIYAQHEDP
jgi:hypothetical protein